MPNASSQRRGAAALLVVALAASVSARAQDEAEPDTIVARLQRLDLRTTELVEREKGIRDDYALAEASIARGKLLAAQAKDKQAAFQSAAQTRTVRAALGEGEPRGLEWHCTRARAIVPQLARFAAAADTVLADYNTRLRAVRVGADGASSTLQTLHSELAAAAAALAGTPEARELRADLDEIELGLQHAWGSYTTLAQLGAETTETASALAALVATMTPLARTLERDIRGYREEREVFVRLLAEIEPEFPPDVVLHGTLRARLDGSRLPGLRNDPFGISESTLTYSRDWQKTADAANEAVKNGTSRLAAAAAACRDWERPDQDFAAARNAAQQPIRDRLIRVDENYAARAQEIRDALRTADEVRRTSEATVADLDGKIATVQDRGRQIAPGDTANQERLRALLEQGNGLRSEAVAEIARMRSATAALEAEARVAARQRAAMAEIGAALLLPADAATRD